jgi:hypothetical protein
LTTFGTESDRVQRLVGVHLAIAVGVARDLPAGQVDRLQAGLDLLHGLVAGQRAERVDEGLGVDRGPQLLGAALGQRVLDRDGAAQADHVGGGVAARDALPARVLGPVLSRAAICCSRVSCVMVIPSVSVKEEERIRKRFDG